MQPKFIHLHLHTEYSIIDGLVKVEELIDQCVKNNIPSIAITDLCNFFTLIKFYKTAIENGIKPIIGTDILVEDAFSSHLTLLCQNNIGYKNLIKLISRAYISGSKINNVPSVKLSWFKELNEGIIVLSGQFSELGHAILTNNNEKISSLLDFWKKYFSDRFYIEIQRLGLKDEDLFINKVLKIASNEKIPLVVTNNVKFIKKDDFEAHEARVCIHDGHILEDAKRPRLYTENQYLRTEEEMLKLFEDIPEAVENTVEIAKRCNLILSFDQTYLPNFKAPNNDLSLYFSRQVKEGLIERNIEIEKLPHYEQRLEYEINVINQMGFAGYFLIVADFVKWAKKNDIAVGPGRGSGAGSLSAYALGITELDPIKHDLLFERFLNPERISMPDFDIDFCMEKRDLVIDYVTGRYGKDSVSQIITFGTMAAKAVIRDVGRVLGHPYGYVDKIAKLIPFELGITLTKALTKEENLKKIYDDDQEAKELIDLALKLEGTVRNVGKHAGGLVIAPSFLTDFTPLYCEENKNIVTQFDKNDIETIGLVKFDFLGLRTLTIIDWVVKSINEKKQPNDSHLNINDIDINDSKTYEMLRSCSTTAVFQLESRGMKELIKKLQPDCFDDIVALVALFRPGPLQSGMVDDFIERKHKRAPISYLHPDLKPILISTYGIILYQEQVMEIARVLAGYTLGAADLLRRAMGKKKPEEMANQRASFVEGAIKNNIDKSIANEIFNLMEKFAGYGFNKSHSVGYALIAYQTAWLRNICTRYKFY